MIDNYERTDLLAVGATRTGTIAILGQLKSIRNLMWSGMPSGGEDKARLRALLDETIKQAEICAEQAEIEYEENG